MDKKILLSGAAALLLVGNMYATPANAAIDLSVSGEASVSIIMSDKCGANSATAAAVKDILGVANLAALDTKVGHSAHVDDNTVIVDHNATFTDYRCTDPDDAAVADGEDNPEWSYGKSITFSASGTLANGLGVSFSDTLDLVDRNDKQTDFGLTLDGAFGSVTFANDGDSGVKAAMVGDTTGADVVGSGKAEHSVATSGTAAFGVLYQAPAIGPMDLFVSYYPNSDGSGVADAQYQDTFGIGLTYSMDNIKIGAGFESATSKDTSCKNEDNPYTFAHNDTTSAAAIVSGVFGDTVCGNQSVMALGAEFSVADMTLSAAYSNNDSDGADLTTTSFGIGTSVGDYSLAADYTKQDKAFEVGGEGDSQTVIHVGASTSLGDGVDLGLDWSTNNVNLFSQAEGAGATNNYRAEAKLTVKF